jgi:hypothetical protein
MEMLSKKEIGTAKVMASTTDAVFFRHANTFERYEILLGFQRKLDGKTLLFLIFSAISMTQFGLNVKKTRALDGRP